MSGGGVTASGRGPGQGTAGEGAAPALPAGSEVVVGADGLARAPETIRVAEVLGAVDETVSALHVGAGASGGQSGTEVQSRTNRLWEGLSAHVYVFLHQTRLSDVVDNSLAPCPAVPSIFAVVDDDKA